MSEMHDPYEDQLAAARYRAERDQARQECERLRARLRDSVPREAYERRRTKWLRQIRECETALHRRREYIKKLENAALERRTVREEDREAAAWVREHGGLEMVKSLIETNVWAHSLAIIAHDALFGEDDERDVTPTEFKHELDRRLMPEGMEWLVEVWPKWSNGEYCKFGDWWKSDKYGEPEPRQFRKLSIYTPDQLREWGQDDGESYGYEWDFMRPSDPKYRPDKVEPPAPKVLDADGVEIRVGDTVYSAENGTEYEVCEAKLPRVTVEYWCAGISAHSSIVPSLLTHRAPVLAADGKPLREGETVWSFDSGTRYTVDKITDELIVFEYKKAPICKLIEGQERFKAERGQ